MMDYIYALNEFRKAQLGPTNMAIQTNKKMIDGLDHSIPFWDLLNAANGLLERTTAVFPKPEFAITLDNVDIQEEVVMDHSFCELRHFKRVNSHADLPRLLIVAPMSGHFATLLRDTIRVCLADHDVYVTDWKDAKLVPVELGDFTLDSYISYLLDFIRYLGQTELHILAVCQPAVPVLAAVSLLATYGENCQPKSMTLMGGPIDARINPGKVSEFTKEYDVKWVEQNMMTRVSAQHKGFDRKIIPGFALLSGFMAMNPERHKEAMLKFFEHLVHGDLESADKHEAFYNEYRSVMDVSASYFLESYERVFCEYLLPKGKLYWNDYLVRPQDIKKTALLTIEGELDDISPVGQTRSAQKLCSGLESSKKQHYVQEKVGHYGIFNGRRWKECIYPVVKDFIKTHRT